MTRHPEYLATPDVDHPDTLTLWHQPPGCHAMPHPNRRAYGPHLTRADIPAELRDPQRSEWIGTWIRTVQTPWFDKMRAALAAEPTAAAGRYAATQGKCCCCNQQLDDPASLRIGAGPDCRDGWPTSALDALTAAVAAAGGPYSRSTTRTPARRRRKASSSPPSAPQAA